jgi:hypothetical protein
MRISQRSGTDWSPRLWRAGVVLPFFILAGLLQASPSAQAGVNISVWDTSSGLGDTIDLESRSAWKPVPNDFLNLEADPAKAKSDPGYYGREYSPKGDIVVENRALAAVFWSAKGRAVFFAKATSAADATKPAPPLKISEFVPLEFKNDSARIARVRILRNTDDESIIEATFAGKDGAERTATFSFDKTEIAAIKPEAAMKGVSLPGPIAYAAAPSFVADDLVISPAEYPSEKSLSLPADNALLGLLQGGESVLTLTWPEGKQRIRLDLGPDGQPDRAIESIDIENDGKAVYLAASRAPGIWRREVLKPSYLEKDTASDWRRPFPAKWKTQLREGDARTTFSFRQSAQEIWRGVAGSFAYPVWFSGDTAMFHLSKKIPPKGEAVIYYVEGQDTPAPVSTPMDFIKATLGRELADSLIDPAGRALRTHHRRGGAGVHRACTCGCTEAIQAVFQAGQEFEKQDYISEAVDDMQYFVQRHVARIDEYRRFADEMTALFQARAATTPGLKTYADSLAEIIGQIPREYAVQKENMKSAAYADDLARRTRALAGKKDAKNLDAYNELLELWRGMGGAQDYVLAQCHLVTRKLYQEAGYGCVTRPEAVELARDIRQRCRACLRNPDGYEIWPDY